MPKRANARLPRGFRDTFSEDYRLRQRILDTIRAVYESYGFEPLETPAVEFVETLGKFLPDSDTPEAGIFAFNPEDQWLALRYDLTAPLSRIVAMYKDLPRPFRRYQVGPVWRLEKPGPGRYREFYQFDIDTVGSGLMAADAEICIVLCDALDALGFKTGEYLIKVSNRKVLDGVIRKALVSGPGEIDQAMQLWFNERKGRLSGLSREALFREFETDIMRSVDKLDRIGLDGVIELLEEGRRDETGDFTPGCHLKDKHITAILDFLQFDSKSRESLLDGIAQLELEHPGPEGLAELREIHQFLDSAGYHDDRIRFDPQIVRGLAYYTGPVYEAFLTIPTTDAKGKPVQFGSVGGGGRYDDLVERFTGQKIPATGASIGVDRLLIAYKSRSGDITRTATQALVAVMDKPRLSDYQKMAQELRAAGIATELYLGKQGIGGQTKYADQRGIIVAVIAGENEFAQGVVTLKDMRLGTELAEQITERDAWRKGQPAQVQVPREKLVEGIRQILSRYA